MVFKVSNSLGWKRSAGLGFHSLCVTLGRGSGWRGRGHGHAEFLGQTLPLIALSREGYVMMISSCRPFHPQSIHKIHLANRGGLRAGSLVLSSSLCSKPGQRYWET